MTTYDPKIIHQFAEQLYSKANRIILRYTLVYAFIGGLIGFALSAYAARGDGAIPATAVTALVGAAMGFSTGRERAFLLKLQAQQALCQMQIEANTRRPVVNTDLLAA